MNKHQELIREKVDEFLDRNKLVFFYHDKKLREEGHEPADHSEAAGMVLKEVLQDVIDTVLAEEREDKRNLYEGLQMMFEQYCPNGNHQFMMAGENAEDLLEQFHKDLNEDKTVDNLAL